MWLTSSASSCFVSFAQLPLGIVLVSPFSRPLEKRGRAREQFEHVTRSSSVRPLFGTAVTKTKLTAAAAAWDGSLTSSNPAPDEHPPGLAFSHDSTRPFPLERTAAIMTSALGVQISPHQLRKTLDRRAVRALEPLLGEGLIGKESAFGVDPQQQSESRLRDLLGIILALVGGDTDEDQRRCAASVVLKCPALLACDPNELLSRVQELRDMEGVTEDSIKELMIEHPCFLTLPPVGRQKIGFFVGQVGMTAKEIARLAKRRPDVIDNGKAYRVHRLVDFFLDDLEVDKAVLRRMISRQPGLLSLSLSEDLLQKTDFFLEELGLSKNQLAKMIGAHPQILALSLEKSIRPLVQWLGSPDPAVVRQRHGLPPLPSGVTAGFNEESGDGAATAALWSQSSSSSSSSSPSPSPSSSSSSSSMRGVSELAPSESNNSWHRKKSGVLREACASRGEVDRNASITSNAPGVTTHTAGMLEHRVRRAKVMFSDKASERHTLGVAEVASAPPVPIDMPTYDKEEWGWGLGLGAEGRTAVVSKQGDILWKSVPMNLAKSAAWFVQEVGLSWDDLRKLVSRSPALLSLSIENNLEPSLGFLVKELGMDTAKVRQIVVNQPSLLTLSVPSNLRPKVALFRDELGARESDIADLINNCPRVMNASVKGRILPRVQAMRAAGMSPAFSHIRAICNYPEAQFEAWMARLLVPEHEAVANPGPTLVSTTLDNGRVMPSGPTPALSSTHTTKTRYASSSKESIAADDVVISGVIEGSTKDGVATTSAAFIPPAIPRRRRGRQPRGEGDARRPSVRTDALAELGLSYAVTSLRRGAANPAVVADASPGHVTGLMVVSAGDAAAAEEKEAFAPGRTEAKALVRRLSRGLDVLDLYCGTGGFALNAAAGGARSARGVDKAARAIRTCKKNAAANGLGDTASFTRADVLSFADEAVREERVWDLVVIDPPSFSTKLARSNKRALNTYTRMAESVPRLVQPGGMLLVVHEPEDGLFDAPEDMTEVLSSAAAWAARISLTFLDSGESARTISSGDSSTDACVQAENGLATAVAENVVDPARDIDNRGTNASNAGVLQEGQKAPLLLWWTLFLCSESPITVDKN